VSSLDKLYMLSDLNIKIASKIEIVIIQTGMDKSGCWG